MADTPDTQSTEEGQEPKKKSKILLFIILGLVLLLLTGGGFFAYTKFLAPAANEEEPAAEEIDRPIIGEIFTLEPFVVNLLDPRGKRYLKVQIVIEMENIEAVAKAEQVVPRLRDAVIMMLTGLTFEDVMVPEGKVRIRHELIDRFNQIMRPKRITNIYFTEFVVQ